MKSCFCLWIGKNVTTRPYNCMSWEKRKNFHESVTFIIAKVSAASIFPIHRRHRLPTPPSTMTKMKTISFVFFFNELTISTCINGKSTLDKFLLRQWRLEGVVGGEWGVWVYWRKILKSREILWWDRMVALPIGSPPRVRIPP